MFVNHDRFPRPDGALTADDIKVGVEFYEVKGTVYGGNVDEKYKKVVTREICDYSNSALYPFHNSGEMKDYKVFEAHYVSNPFSGVNSTSVEFTNDMNLFDTNRYNDNFIFSDFEKAKKYSYFVTDFWMDHPEPKQAVLEEHRSWDDMFDRYSDTDYEYNDSDEKYEDRGNFEYEE